jgi:hypothetical protein
MLIRYFLEAINNALANISILYILLSLKLYLAYLYFSSLLLRCTRFTTFFFVFSSSGGGLLRLVQMLY